MSSRSLHLEISSLPLCLGITTNVFSASAQKFLKSFVFYLGKAVSSSRTLYIVLKSSHSKTYGPDGLSTETSRPQLVKAKKRFSNVCFRFFKILSFYPQSPKYPFGLFLAEVLKYEPSIWANRDSYYYHRLDGCISENLLFPYHSMELSCSEAI